MLAEKRQQLILEMLKNNGVIKMQDICEKTDCSESSARRDLQLLEEQGLLVRVHGGAKMKYSLQREMDMSGKENQNISAKEAIAKFAAKLIRDDDVIYLDAGSTTLALIKYLGTFSGLTVVTNGVQHASALADQNVRTILVGGQLKNSTKALVGPQTVSDLQRLRFNKAFLGINGIHPKYGYTTPDPSEAAVKQVALEQSEKAYVLADASKFNNVSFVKIADLGAAEIITQELSNELFAHYSSQTTIQEAKEK